MLKAFRAAVAHSFVVASLRSLVSLLLDEAFPSLMSLAGHSDSLLVASRSLVRLTLDWFEGFFSGVSRRLLKVDEG